MTPTPPPAASPAVKIWIVQGYIWDYDETHAWNVCCFYEKEKAEKLAEELSKLYQKTSDFLVKENMYFSDFKDTVLGKKLLEKDPNVIMEYSGFLITVYEANEVEIRQ